MARSGFMKTGWISLIAAAIITVTGCGSTNNQAVTTVNADQPGQATTAPSEAPPQTETRVVTDAFGEVEIPTNPKRVSALYREDYLVALGVTPIVQYYNPMWGKQDYLKLDVPLFDVTGSIEAMLVSKPDLIIGAGEVDADQYKLYSKVAPTFRLPDDVLADSRKTLTLIADLLGLSDKAEQVLADYETRIVDVKAKLNAAIGEEKLVVLRMNVADKSINIFGTHNTFVGQILYEDLGLKAPKFAEEMTEGNIVLSNEVIPELDADHIILLPSNGTWEEESNAKALEKMMADPLWQNVPAIKNGHVYPVERSYWQTGAITANGLKMDDLLRLLAS
ncbi:ABC transporter substrate-binding protein [Paenibacillus glycanilyticus]|uniref:Ferrichrome ABC transporter substrate-binding protein n=1 Tax=Paenibacillus glycanilyticus TaxID=126569 RepID=A0ABQ6GJL5_9BACL|nr:ABC transporter substrate-binding protein [Paenibacillus glycanilyticus]GLX70680.1 ferrichrome ABC transporter substrate-binding protein [Paenibacillus glycanilyticus]